MAVNKQKWKNGVSSQKGKNGISKQGFKNGVSSQAFQNGVSPFYKKPKKNGGKKINWNNVA